MFKRWWVYQNERFPVLINGPMIFAITIASVAFSLHSRGEMTLPSLMTMMVSFFSAFLFFLQLRIADEFKDIEADARFRPYRPVPRGLITLEELGVLGAASILAILALVTSFSPSLLPILFLVWAYMGLMTKEFYIENWLRSHPIVYMWTHTLILPLIFFYLTACDWHVVGARPPTGLHWLLFMSFLNGFVFEIGRKIRAPEDEENGVETYSLLWGRKNAVLAWLGAQGITTAVAIQTAAQIGITGSMSALMGILLLTSGWISWRFLRRPAPKSGRIFELVSGAGIFLMYLTLGILPLWKII